MFIFRKNPRNQRGVSTVELALLLPVVLGMLWLAVDLFKVNIARTKLEQASYALSSTIAGQRELEQESVNLLLNSLTDKLLNFEIVFAQVQGNNEADWIIRQGSRSGLCSVKFAGNAYMGTIPVIADREDSMPPVIVVQMCSSVSELQLFFNFLSNKEALETVSVSRVMTGQVNLGESFAE